MMQGNFHQKATHRVLRIGFVRSRLADQLSYVPCSGLMCWMGSQDAQLPGLPQQAGDADSKEEVYTIWNGGDLLVSSSISGFEALEPL